jgi:hypothetical protein
VLAAAGAANAAVVTQTLPFAFPLSPGNQVLAFNQFNGALGTLTKVEMLFDGTIDASATAENDSVLAAPGFALNLSGNMSVTFATLSGVGIVNTNFFQALAPTDNGGTANGSGPDFHDFGNVGDVIGGDDDTMSGLGVYVGGGTINANINGSAGFSFSGTTDATLGIDDLGTAGEVTINYYYDPIPAPGAAALLGLAGVAGTRRRR